MKEIFLLIITGFGCSVIFAAFKLINNKSYPRRKND